MHRLRTCTWHRFFLFRVDWQPLVSIFASNRCEYLSSKAFNMSSQLFCDMKNTVANVYLLQSISFYLALGKALLYSNRKSQDYVFGKPGTVVLGRNEKYYLESEIMPKNKVILHQQISCIYTYVYKTYGNENTSSMANYKPTFIWTTMKCNSVSIGCWDSHPSSTATGRNMINTISYRYQDYNTKFILTPIAM